MGRPCRRARRRPAPSPTACRRAGRRATCRWGGACRIRRPGRRIASAKRAEHGGHAVDELCQDDRLVHVQERRSWPRQLCFASCGFLRWLDACYHNRQFRTEIQGDLMTRFSRLVLISCCAAAVALAQEPPPTPRSEEQTSELQSRQYLVCRLL